MERGQIGQLGAALGAAAVVSIGWAVAMGVDPGPVLPVAVLYIGIACAVASLALWLWDFLRTGRREAVPPPRFLPRRWLRCTYYPTDFKRGDEFPHQQDIVVLIRRKLPPMPAFRVECEGQMHAGTVSLLLSRRGLPEANLSIDVDHRTPHGMIAQFRLDQGDLGSSAVLLVHVASNEPIYVKSITALSLVGRWGRLFAGQASGWKPVTG